MNKILVSGYYGFGNLGDEAILAAMIYSLRQSGVPVKITVLSHNPELTGRMFAVDAVSRTSLPQIYREIADCDVLVSGGGSLLQDVTGWKSIPYYLFLAFWAQLWGKKTVFYAQGIGPINYRMNKIITKKVLQNADHISVRDPQSAAVLERMKLQNQIQETVDPVFVFRNEDLPRIDLTEILSIKENHRLVGVAVRPWEGNQYLEVLARGLNSLAQKTGAYPVLIPMNYDKDLQISQKLASRLDVEHEILDQFHDPCRLLAFFSELDFLVGVRLHSLIFAAFNQVPFVGLSYDPKVASFAKLFTGIKTLPINNLASGYDFENCLEQSWENRKNIAQELGEKKDIFREKCRENIQRVINLF